MKHHVCYAKIKNNLVSINNNYSNEDLQNSWGLAHESFLCIYIPSRLTLKSMITIFSFTALATLNSFSPIATRCVECPNCDMNMGHTNRYEKGTLNWIRVQVTVNSRALCMSLLPAYMLMKRHKILIT